MSPHLQRAQLLIQQGRHADAERELGLALGQNPDDAWAHGLLGVCLLGRKAYDEAGARGRQAVALAPDSADIRHLAARIERDRNRLDDAERLFSEAIALDPYDPRYFAGRAGVHAQRKHWQKVLDDCRSALELDPEETEAINLRSLANRGLGKMDQGVADVEQALRVDPDDAATHANLGWAHLQQGDHRKAETHFREALRLDPSLDWARQGVMEATKARFPPYRWLLAYFIWMAQRTGAVQIAVVVGLWFGSRIIRSLALQFPTAAPFLWVLLGVYVLACVATWIARPMSNTILMLHPFGRLALDRQEKIEAGVVIGWLAISLAGAVIGLFAARPALVELALGSLFVWVPVAMAFQMPAKKPRQIMAAAAVVVAAMATIDFGVGWMVERYGPEQAVAMIPSPLIGFIRLVHQILPYTPLAALFGANYLSTKTWGEH